MQLTTLFEEYKTKDGQTITMTRIDDSEHDENRGWQVDMVRAYVDEKEVGYIKLSYIPHERFHRHFKTIFDFLNKNEGWSFGPSRWEPSKHYKEWAPDVQHAALKSLAHIVGGFSPDEERRVANLSELEVSEELKTMEQNLLNGVPGKKFKQFKNFHKDKPLVDFINVEQDWRRQRIGEALYREGAIWMKEKGLQMYASGTQSDEAKASWKHMKQNLTVKRAKRGRKILVPVE